MSASAKKDDARTEKVAALQQLFEKAEIPYEIPEHMMHKMWSKLMVNTGVNQSTAVLRPTTEVSKCRANRAIR
ncbi:hypothetical protein NBRC111894_3753 [Sporolactobacillus inulinus]|uniref:Uncharacterized protein n=1 Tax=Sporolactobacillus inulinus TaxID=2078 RepID=A0A4Y1ZGQ7_9BACL|nr:hypothetical protein NBRC111894_3753 [Sporolactobacillus inulinus]